MVFAMMPMIAARVYAEGSVPVPDITYTSDSDWEGTLEVNEDKTIELNGVTHDNSGTTYGSAIKICEHANVNIVLNGSNVINANPAIISAGIEVEEGSTVNIYGADGGTLNVTGGKFSAGIGGIGYGNTGGSNPKAGNINI